MRRRVDGDPGRVSAGAIASSATLWSMNWLEGVLVDHKVATGRLMGGHLEWNVGSHLECNAPLGCVTHESKSFQPVLTDFGSSSPAVDYPAQTGLLLPFEPLEIQDTS